MTDKAKEGRNTTQILAQIDAEIARLEQAGSLPVVRKPQTQAPFLSAWVVLQASIEKSQRAPIGQPITFQAQNYLAFD
jgi:hypothetical protein